MPAPFAALLAALVGLAAGVTLHLRLSRREYRLPDEGALLRLTTWWVIPTTAIASGLVWWAISPVRPLVVPAVYVIATWVLVALMTIDIDVHRLPDRIQLPAYPTLVVLLAVCSLASGEWTPFARSLIAGVALFALYLVLALLPGGGIGFGDVKLAGLLGMLLGWLSWTHVMQGTLATFLLGGVIAAALMVLRRKGARDEFAYGPPMIIGAVGAIVVPALLQAL